MLSNTTNYRGIQTRKGIKGTTSNLNCLELNLRDIRIFKALLKKGHTLSAQYREDVFTSDTSITYKFSLLS